jgi:hypothetical protein
VLVVGGMPRAELYEPGTRTFTPVGQKMIGWVETATLLPDGRVILVGQRGEGPEGSDPAKFRNHLNGSMVYDPDGQTFTGIDGPLQARGEHTATLLADGRLVIAGGIDNSDNRRVTTELFDPVSDTFSFGPDLVEWRDRHTATHLPDGRVVFIGGQGLDGPLSSVEVLDPTTDTIEPAGSLQVGRIGHASALLEDGRILVSGGWGASDTPLSSVEIYDPTSQSSVLVQSQLRAGPPPPSRE